MAFDSDAALAQIPEELRAQMPGLGFRRDRDGRFFYFPHAMMFWGAYEVPAAELPRLAWDAHAQRKEWAHFAPALAAIAVFAIALAAGVLLIDAHSKLQLHRIADRHLPGMIFGGSFCMAAVAATLWSRLRSGRFVRRHLGGMRYDRKAHRFHIDDRLAGSGRAKLGGALLGPVALVLAIQVTWAIEEFPVSPLGLRLYNILSCVIFLAISAVLAAMVFSDLRPRRRWVASSSWAASDETAARGRNAAKVASKPRPLWRKLLIPSHGWGARGFLLDVLHVGVYTVILAAPIVLTMHWWYDRRPADADLLAFFAEVTVPPAGNAELAPVIVKWTTGPAVHLAGGDAEREGEALDEALHSLSLLSGLDWHRAASADTADVLIEVTYADDDEEPQADADQGNVNYTFDRSGALTGGRLMVRDRDLYHVILHWGLAEVAGLRGETSFGSNSVTSGASSFTALDRTALLLLYSAEIEPGSSTEDAAEKAREIVAAWPETYTVEGLQDALAQP